MYSLQNDREDSCLAGPSAIVQNRLTDILTLRTISVHCGDGSLENQ
jgi:hypothetical protein